MKKFGLDAEKEIHKNGDVSRINVNRGKFGDAECVDIVTVLQCVDIVLFTALQFRQHIPRFSKKIS